MGIRSATRINDGGEREKKKGRGATPRPEDVSQSN
jgi:hypothetical protein